MCGVGRREDGSKSKSTVSASGGAKGRSKRGKKDKKKDKDDEDAGVKTQVPSVARGLWEKGCPLSDLVIEAVSEDGHTTTEVSAHRCFLAAVSNVFKDALYGPGAPAKPADGPVRLRIEDVDVVALQECVRWCYVETWSEDPELVARCAAAARRFDVPGLLQACCHSVRENFSTEAVLQALEGACNAFDRDLMFAAVEGACRDARAIVDSAAFKDISPRAMDALVGCTTFGVEEEVLVAAVLQWADHRAIIKGAELRRGARAAASGAGGTSSASSGPQATGESLLAELSPKVTAEEVAAARAAAVVAVQGLKSSADAKAAIAAAMAAASASASADGADDADAAAAAAGSASGDDTAYSYSATEGEAGSMATDAAAIVRPVNILKRLRLPLMKQDALVRVVKAADLLSPKDFAALVAHSFKSKEDRAMVKSVAGFSNIRREGAERTLHIHMWGGGGATGQNSGPQYGGAGGYLCVEYALPSDDRLTVYVGGGGYADASGGNDALSTVAWPNGGSGGTNWVSGGGGGASFVRSLSHKDEVIAGAGGGGGGPASSSWSSAGGGGGGTKDGRMGTGGNGGNQAKKEPTKGTDGAGDGGKPDGSGSRAKGASKHGAGGGPGSSSNANGGDGGESSCAHATELLRIAATDSKAVVPPGMTLSAGRGGRPNKPKERGEPGLVTIDVEETGEHFEFKFTGEPQEFEYEI
jgi:hypothetical protein